MIFFITTKIEWLWGLVIPLGIVVDFWRLAPLGLTGLKIILLVMIFHLFRERFRPPEGKIKV